MHDRWLLEPSEVQHILDKQQSLYVFSELGETKDAFINTFSLLKLGEANSVNQFSQELITRIRQDFSEDLDVNLTAVCAPPSTIEHAAGLMASQVAAALYLPTVEIVKQKPLGDYSLMSKVADREQAVSNTMVVKNAANVRGKHVVVIDDVLVTGSVLKELARALLVAGAKRVTIFTIFILDDQDFSLEGKINEAAISLFLYSVLQSINECGAITSAFLKAMVRMSKQDSLSFQQALANLHPEARFELFFACMKYQLMTRGKGGYLTLPDPEFMAIFEDFLP